MSDLNVNARQQNVMDNIKGALANRDRQQNIKAGEVDTSYVREKDNIDDMIKRIEKDKSGYLTMFIEQLKHQMPDAPMEPGDMMQQLANMGSMEATLKQTKISAKILESYQTTQMVQFAENIGKFVEVPSNQCYFDQTEPVSFSYHVPSGFPQNAKVSVLFTSMDGEKKVVRALEGDASKGRHDIAWSGKTLDDTLADSGHYHIKVMVMDEKGNLIKNGNGQDFDIPTHFIGRAQASKKVDGIPGVVLGGKIAVPLDRIVQINSSEDAGRQAATSDLKQLQASLLAQVEQVNASLTGHASGTQGLSTVRPYSRNGLISRS